MSSTILKNMTVAGVPVVGFDATGDFTTDGLPIRCRHCWSFQVENNTVGGNPRYTIEVSNDDVTWHEYDSSSTSVPLDESFTDEIFAFRFLRIVYVSGGGVAGTVTFNAVFK